MRNFFATAFVALAAMFTVSASAEEVQLVCPQVIPAAIKICNERGVVPCVLGHKVQRYGHEYNEYTLIEFDATGYLVMQGDFKGVLIDYDSDGIIDRQPTLLGGYDSRKNHVGRNGSLNPTGKFSGAQAAYETECAKLASIVFPEAVAMATDPPVE